eukprot:9220374-Pyramimonas_sp.AAC.1
MEQVSRLACLLIAWAPLPFPLRASVMKSFQRCLASFASSLRLTSKAAPMAWGKMLPSCDLSAISASNADMLVPPNISQPSASNLGA